MKSGSFRVIGALSIVVILLSLVACSTSSSTSSTSSKTSTSTSSQTTIVSSTASPVPGKVYTLKMQDYYPKGQPVFEGSLKTFATRVNQMSGGRIIIQTFGVGEIVEDANIFDAVSSGTIQLARTSQSSFAGKIPSGKIKNFGPQTPDEENVLYYDRGYNAFERKVMAPFGVYFLGPMMQGGAPWIFRKPVTSLADIKGLKMRGTGELPGVIQALGGTPTTVAYSDVYLSLANGVIDGANAGSPAELNTMGTTEVAKYMVMPYVFDSQTACVIVNLKAWNELPSDLQAILDVATRQLSDDQYSYFQANDQQSLKLMQSKGLQINTLSAQDQAQLKALKIQVMQGWAASDPATAEGLKLRMDFLTSVGR